MNRLARIKLVLLVLLVGLILLFAGLLMFTPTGQAIRSNPHAFGADFRQWVAHRRVMAPVVFVLLYVLFGVMTMPVWPLQVLAGYGFGVTVGIFWATVGSMTAATVTVRFAHFLAGDYFHDRVEMRTARLHALMEKLGHNGLLSVMAVRLLHVIPFGLSNYVFGLTSIRLLPVAVGTGIGGLPALAGYVAAASPLRDDWRFWTVLGGLNLALLLPFGIRWLAVYRRNAHRKAIRHDPPLTTTGDQPD